MNNYLRTFQLDILDVQTGESLFAGVSNIVINVAKQELNIYYDIYIPSSKNQDVVILVRTSKRVERLNIDETTIEATLWAAITNYLNDGTIENLILNN